MNEADYITVANLKASIDAFDAQIDDLERRWAEMLEFAARSENETHSLLQDAQFDLQQDRDSILDELEKNDIEILKRTAGLDTLADDLQYSADNFVATTQGFVDSFQAQFQTNKLERAEAKEFYDSILAEYDAMVATKTQEYDSLVENGNALIEQESQNLASLLGTRMSDATQNARFEDQLAIYDQEGRQSKIRATNTLKNSIFLLPNLEKSITEAVSYTEKELEYFHSLKSSFSVYKTKALDNRRNEKKKVYFDGVLHVTNAEFNPITSNFETKIPGDYFFTMTMAINSAGPVSIFITKNGNPSGIEILLEQKTRLQKDLYSASGFLTLDEGDKVNVMIEQNGLQASPEGPCTFSGHLLQPHIWEFDEDSPSFDRRYLDMASRVNNVSSERIQTSGFRVKRNDMV